ncbi:unnamed protein product [Laminaria digitata]
MDAAEMNMFGTGGGFGGGGGLGGSGGRDTLSMSQTLGQQPTTNAVPPSASPSQGASASAGDCHYFLQGACTKGYNCLFRHSQAAMASGTVCRFWQSGFCKDAANCSFQHPASGARGHGAGGARGGRFATGRGMGGGRGAFAGGRGGLRPQAWEAVDRSKQSCVFFAQGKCAKGDACPFSHGTPAEGGNHQEADPVNPAQRAAVPDGRVRAGPGQPFARGPAGRDDTLPQSEQLGSDRTNGAIIDRPSHATHGEDLPRTSAVRRSEPEPPRHQDSKFRGAPLSTGPPAVFGAGGKAFRDLFQGRHDQARTATPLQQREKAPSQAGIIALSDGGFVTRKRAAELQLLKDDHSGAEPRRVRPRDGREQVRAQEPRPGMPESRAAPPGGKLSILDRLGPVKQAPASAPARERAVGPVQTRPDVPGPPFRAREEPPRQHHSEPADRPRNSLQPLSRPQGLGAARPTRRTEGGKGDSVSTGKGLPARQNVQHKPVPAKLDFKMQHKPAPAKLDFKITSLGEIKSRKAKAEVTGAGVALREAQNTAGEPKSGRGLATVKGSSFETAAASGFSAAVTQEVQAPAPAPSAPAVPFDPPQLDAEDMDEFSEWL